MDERLDFFRRLTGSEFRDVVFFLTVPPDVAVSRIEKRIAEEAMGQQSTRPKWKHMHERAEHLGRLQEEYYAAIDTASKKGAKEIHEIDTSNSSQHEVADFILSTLNDLLT